MHNKTTATPPKIPISSHIAEKNKIGTHGRHHVGPAHAYSRAKESPEAMANNDWAIW